MSGIVRWIFIAAALFLVSVPTCPTWGQQSPATPPQVPTAAPFVGDWEGVVSINNQNNPVRITIAPFANGFAAKVVVYRDGNWRASPIVQLLFQGDVFSLKFPSGNSYDGMHTDGNTLRGFFYLKNVGQTAAVQFTRG